MIQYFEMGSNKSTIGRIGEDIACKFLINKKYKILARNYRKKWGEIDIVSRAPDGTLVFVEVKTMALAGEGFLKPEDQASGSKMRKVRKTCNGFVNANPSFVDEKRGWRIDLVAIVMGPSSTEAVVGKDVEPMIRHYENV